MERIIGYQFSETGNGGVYYYREKEFICKVITGLFFPVWISGLGREWKSKYQMQGFNIVSERSKKVIDDKTGEAVARVECIKSGQYRINDAITVIETETEYTFFNDDTIVAKTTPIKDKNVWIPEEEWKDFEPYNEINLYEEVDDDMLLLILGFPALKIGLGM